MSGSGRVPASKGGPFTTLGCSSLEINILARNLLLTVINYTVKSYNRKK